MDHIFLLDDLKTHLDEMQAVGANYVRNTMSQREDEDIKPHKLLVRDGNDLICQVPIGFSQAALGGTIVVPTLTGSQEIEIPSGTQHGDVIKLKKQDCFLIILRPRLF